MKKYNDNPNPPEWMHRILDTLVNDAEQAVLVPGSPVVSRSAEQSAIAVAEKALWDRFLQLALECRADEIRLALGLRGRVLVHGVSLPAEDKKIDPEFLEQRLKSLKDKMKNPERQP